MNLKYSYHKNNISNRGFSLVEVIVAMAVLSLVIASLMTLLNFSFGNIYSMGAKTVSLNDIQEKMESAIVIRKGNYKQDIIIRNESGDEEFRIDKEDGLFISRAENYTNSRGMKREITLLAYIRKEENGNGSNGNGGGGQGGGDDFATYVTEENVFVYGTNLALTGSSSVYGDDDNEGTVVINNTSNTDLVLGGGGTVWSLKYIYIDKSGNTVRFTDSAKMGVAGLTELVNIKGNVELNNGGAEINGKDIYIEGDVVFNNSAKINGNLVYIKGNVDFRNPSAEINADTLFIEGNVTTSTGGKINDNKPDGSVYISGNLNFDASNNSMLQGNIFHIIGGINLNNGTTINVNSIYAQGNVNLDPNAQISGAHNIHVVGSTDVAGGASINNNGMAYILGNVGLLGNNSRITGGTTHVDGDVTLNHNHADITGELSHTGSLSRSVSATIIGSPLPFPALPAFPLFPTIPPQPNLTMPSLRPDSWYLEEKGYVAGGNLGDGIKIFSQGDYSYSHWDSVSNVIIVSKGDITISGSMGLTGVLFAPHGKVSFAGAGGEDKPFEGLVIARDGFEVVNHGAKVIFKNISEYIANPDDYPFE